MRITSLVAVVAVAVAAPAVSHAQLQLGGRTGIAFSSGAAGENTQTGAALKMSDWAQVAQVPFQLDAGVEVTPALTLGGYVGLGAGIVGDAFLQDLAGRQLCGTNQGDGTITCTGFDWRLGVQATYAFIGGTFVPWVGLGVGYEAVSTKAEDDAGSLTVKLTGYEVGFQVGGDFRMSRAFAFGPYVAVNVGEFRDIKMTASGSAPTSGEIARKTYHEWIGAGIRGVFHL